MQLAPGIHVSDRHLQRLAIGHGEGVQVWLGQMPQMVTELSELWQLTCRALMSSGVEGLVISCTQSSGDLAVLKLMADPRSYKQQLEILQRTHDLSVLPQIITYDERFGAMLMEHVIGIHPMYDLANDPAVHAAIDRLHQSGLRGTAPLDEYLIGRAGRSLARLSEHDPEAPGWKRSALLRARGSITHLMLDTPRVLLHGDVHVENVLMTPDGEAHLVDPWGLDGDSAFDHATWIGKTAHKLGVAGRIRSEREAAWLRIILPMQAASLTAYDLPGEQIERLWDELDQLRD